MIELLVSLTLLALLVLLVGQSMDRIIFNSQQTEARLANADAITGLRRLLHRDLQSWPAERELRVTSNGLVFNSTHNLLQSRPLPMTVTWLFDKARVTRREVNNEMSYSQEIILLQNLREWKLQLYKRGGGWQDHDSWLLNLASAAEENATAPLALRLILSFGDESPPVEILERAPTSPTT